MTRVLFAWELGAGLGHINRLTAIAAAFAQRGLEPVFVTTNPAAMAKAAARRLAAAPVVPVIAWSPIASRNPGTAPTHTLADILWLLGGDLAEPMKARLDFWRQQIRHWSPDLIVADGAPLALAAAAGRIPSIAVGNAYAIPPLLPALPPIRPWAEAIGEVSRQRENLLRRTFDDIGVSGPLWSEFGVSSLFHGTRTHIGGLSLFDPYARRAARRVEAPVNLSLTAPPARRERSQTPPTAYVYLRKSRPSWSRMPGLFRKYGIKGLVYAPDLDSALKEAFVAAGAEMLDAYFDYGAILPKVDLFVHQGSLGGCIAALYYGTPQLALSANLENLIYGRAVAAVQAGAALSSTDSNDPEKLDKAFALAVGRADTSRWRVDRPGIERALAADGLDAILGSARALL